MLFFDAFYLGNETLMLPCCTESETDSGTCDQKKQTL